MKSLVDNRNRLDDGSPDMRQLLLSTWQRLCFTAGISSYVVDRGLHRS
jgi:hypothetical protein